jgi:hypothetical protein
MNLPENWNLLSQSEDSQTATVSRYCPRNAMENAAILFEKGPERIQKRGLNHFKYLNNQ